MHEKYLGRIKYLLLNTNRADTYYYGNILFSLKTEWTTRLPTAAIDGKTLFLNPDFFTALDEDEAVGVIAHEMCHPIYQHLTTFHLFNRKVFDPSIEWRLWNEAGDHAINLALEEAGYKLPSFRLADPRFKDMATVEIYRILHDEYQQCEWELSDCDLIYIDGEDAAAQRDIGDLDDHIRKIVTRAGITTQMNNKLDWGSMPGDLQRLIHEVENPKLDFSTILINYMTKYRAEDYSYRRPNRRYISQKIYMPTLYSEGLCDLAIWFDVSGSVDDHTVSIFHRALWNIKELLNPEKIHLGQFDTRRIKTNEVESLEDLKRIEFVGGGGTNIQPVIEWIAAHQPEVTLIFTDGYFAEQQSLAGSDIIWIIQDNPQFTAPEGTIIHHNM